MADLKLEIFLFGKIFSSLPLLGLFKVQIIISVIFNDVFTLFRALSIFKLEEKRKRERERGRKRKKRKEKRIRRERN